MRWQSLLTRWGKHHGTPTVGAAALSVDLVYEQVIRALDAQHDHVSTLDTKTGFVLTAASIVIGFQGIPGIGRGLDETNPVWLAPAYAIYVFLLLTLFKAYQLRDFTSRGLEPAELQHYYFDSTEFTKRQFVASMRSAYEQNLAKIDEKVRWLQRSEKLLIAEVVALVVGGVLSHEWQHIHQAAMSVWDRAF